MADNQVEVVVKAVVGDFKSQMDDAASKFQASLNSMTTAANQLTSSMSDVGGKIGSSFENIGHASEEHLGKVHDHAEGAGEALDALKEHVETTAGLFNSAFPQMAGVVELLTSPLAGVTAAVGALIITLHEAVSDTMELTAQAERLSQRLGLTTQDASALNTALKQVGSSGDEYAAAFTHFTRALETHSAQLKLVGIDYAKMREEGLTSSQMFEEALNTLRKYQAGVDQNAVALQLFGRSIDSIFPLLKLHKDALEEARKENEEFNTTITDADRVMRDQFRVAVEQAKAPLEELSLAIGREVIPQLIELANWFRDFGKDIGESFRTSMEDSGEAVNGFATIFAQAVSIIRSTISALVDGFNSLSPIIMFFVKNGLQFLGETIEFFVIPTLGHLAKFIIETVAIIRAVAEETTFVISQLVTTADTASRALVAFVSGNISEARRIWDDGASAIEARARQHVATMEGILRDANNQIGNLGYTPKPATWGGEARGATNTPQLPVTSGTLHAPDFSKAKKGKGQGDVNKAEAEVAKAEAEAELADLKDRLQVAQGMYDEAYKKGLISIQDYYAARLSITQTQLDKEIEVKQKELNILKTEESGAKNKAQKLAIQAQEIRVTEEITILERHRAEAEVENQQKMQDALQKRAEALSKISEEEKKYLAEQQTAQQQTFLNLQKSLGTISNADYIQAHIDLENQKYQIELQGLQDRLKAVQDDEVKRAELLAKEAELYAVHQTKLTSLQAEAIQERMKYEEEAKKSIEGSFESLTDSLVKNVHDWKKAFQSFFDSIDQAIVKAISKQWTDQLFGGNGSIGGGLDNYLGKLFGTGDITSAITGAGNAPSSQSSGGGLLGFLMGDKALDQASDSVASATQTGSSGGIFGSLFGGQGQVAFQNIADYTRGATTALADNTAVSGALNQTNALSQQTTETAAMTTATTALTSFTSALTAAISALTEFAASLGSNMTGAAITGGGGGFGGLGGLLGGFGSSGAADAGTIDTSASVWGDYASAFGGAGSDAIGTAFTMASFDVGTDYVPDDMIAMIHKGEKITPARYNNDNSRIVGNTTINMNVPGVPQDPYTQSQIATKAALAMQRQMGRG